jgi:pSer/pThr/pTyr-binding forkhead associated (FHA) protein
MTDKENATGPQGTQVFDVNDVNQMIANEIANSRTETADTPALIGLGDALNGEQFILSKNKIEVGRRPNSDIVLNESSVSSMHAQIIKDGVDWKVLNLLSSNGTYVNGEKVTEKVILPGDRIAFAEAEFVFTLVDAETEKSVSSGSMGIMAIGIALIAAFAAVLYFII